MVLILLAVLNITLSLKSRGVSRQNGRRERDFCCPEEYYDVNDDDDEAVGY